MPETETRFTSSPHGQENLSKEERKSFTHGDFWIPEAERELYKVALAALNRAAVPYVVTGAYAIYEYTGIYRETKDLDLFIEPERLVEAMRVLKDVGFAARLEQPHWLAKAVMGEHFIDVIFGMGNGLALIDSDWYRHSVPAILAATPVRVGPPEELIWHRLFINERHRQDMADIAHLILCLGTRLDWKRLVEKTGEHWPLLLSQLQMFHYVYPRARDRVPNWVMETLLTRSREHLEPDTSDGEQVTRGTMISRFSFAIDVNEWGFRDLRSECVEAALRLPIVGEIARSDVWDERSEVVDHYLSRTAE
jgi:hypothetical protein